MFCFLFFCFCSFKAFLSLGGPFSYIYLFSGHALSPKVGGPYVFAQFSAKNTDSLHFFLGGPLFCFLFFCFCSFKAFLSLGGPFSYISDFFPKPGAPMFWRNFLPKTLFFYMFFLGGPLFCFLFFCFCSFKAFLSLGGPFLIYTFFFRPRPKPQSRGPLCFCAIFCQKH